MTLSTPLCPSPETLKAPFGVLHPLKQTAPVVFASPHSGDFYPDSFIQSSKLTPLDLRRSEDAFVDALYGDVPQFGAPFLKAHFPRAFVDLNREPYELDSTMFDGPLPSYVNIESPRAAAGLGTIARIVSCGAEIYTHKLSFKDIRDRIDTYYHPYHGALRQLIEDTRGQFGGCLLIDCHSMPSAFDPDPKMNNIDVVLGDRFGTSCATWITDLAQHLLEQEGLIVKRNRPYAGGFTTRHYGAPLEGVHTLQIELNRGLYMDEKRIEPRSNFADVKALLNRFVVKLCQIDPTRL